MRVSVFNMDGKLLVRWGNDGNAGGNRLFVAPQVITVDDRGDLYVGKVAMTHAKLNRGARTLQKFARQS